MANARGEAARAALVGAAERLFAERGVEGVSLRDVSAAAGQRNHSAAQYHFGDRQGLVAAVYENRMRIVNERRLALLAEVDVGDIAVLIELLVVPLVDVVAEVNGSYARFIARTRWEPEAWNALLQQPASASFARMIKHLDRALAERGDLTPAVRRSRLDQLMTLVVGTIAGWEGAPDRGEARLSRALLVDELVATGVALVTAPNRALAAEGANR